MSKIVFLHGFYLALRSRSGSRSKVGSKVKVKGWGQGQISGAQRSIIGARLCRVQQRAIRVITSLKAFVCASVISGRMRIIARMRSIGVLIIYFKLIIVANQSNFLLNLSQRSILRRKSCN